MHAEQGGVENKRGDEEEEREASAASSEEQGQSHCVALVHDGVEKEVDHSVGGVATC